MEYPELNIGEFAGRYSANVYLEHQEDEGYFLMVDVDPEENEKYPVSIGVRPETIEDIADLYEHQFVDFPSDELITVYGSDEDAVNSMRETSKWARFEAPSEDSEGSYEARGWAVDIEPIIRNMNESAYEEIMDEISASTLYVINRAESNGEVGTGLHDFHRELIKEFTPRETEPIRIDVVDEGEPDSEYVEVEGTHSETGEEILEETESEETRFDYDEMVSGTISESKSRIEEVEEQLNEEDWERLLEAERRGDDRITFKPYLEEQLEKEKSEEEDEEQL